MREFSRLEVSQQPLHEQLIFHAVHLAADVKTIAICSNTAPPPLKTFLLLDNLISVCCFCAAERHNKHWTSLYSAYKSVCKNNGSRQRYNHEYMRDLSTLWQHRQTILRDIHCSLYDERTVASINECNLSSL